jgi:hypothetical protein
LNLSQQPLHRHGIDLQQHELIRHIALPETIACSGWILSPVVHQSAELDYKDVTVRFLQGLKETGYVEGQNVAVE